MFDKTGASFTFSIVIPKDIGSDERPPSLTETETDPIPTWFSNGLTVNVEPDILTSNKSLDVLALYVKSVSPSISIALRETLIGVSSLVLISDIVTIAGESFTGSTDTSNDVEDEVSSSLTNNVIVVLPLKLFADDKFIINPVSSSWADTLSFVDETLADSVSKS